MNNKTISIIILLILQLLSSCGISRNVNYFLKNNSYFGRILTDYIAKANEEYRTGDYIKLNSTIDSVYKYLNLTYGDDILDDEEMLNKSIEIFTLCGKYKYVEEINLKSLNKIKTEKGNESQEYCWELMTVADFYQQTGELEKSLKLYSSAQEIIIKNNWENENANGVCQNGLGIVQEKMGYYSRAESFYNNALGIAKSGKSEISVDYATTLSNLGGIYMKLGRYKESEIFYLRALEIYEKINGDNDFYFLNAQTNLAVLYSQINNYTQAIDIFNNVKLKWEKSNYSKLDQIYLNVISSLATNHAMNLQLDEAEELFRIANDIYEARQDIYSLEYSTNLINMSFVPIMNSLIKQKKEFHPQIKEIKKAVNIRTAILGENHPITIQSRTILAFTYFLEGDFKSSFQYLTETYKSIMNIVKNNFPYMSEKEKSDYYATLKGDLDVYYFICSAIAGNQPQAISDMYNLRLLTKGIIGNSTKSLYRKMRHTDDISLVKLFDNWMSMKKSWAGLNLGRVLDDSNKSLYDSLESNINVIEKELNSQADINDDELFKYVDWKNIRDYLKSDEAAVEIIRLPSLFPNIFGKTKYACLIITKDMTDNPEIVVIDDAENIENKLVSEYQNIILDFRKYISNPEYIEKPVTLNVENLLKNFYHILWEPIEKELNNNKIVYISLDGLFHKINLNTLINPVTNRYLIDEHDLRFVTNTKDILNNKKVGYFNDSVNTAVLFGNPAFSMDPHSRAGLAIRYNNMADNRIESSLYDTILRFGFNSLPGTEQEVKIIDSLLNKSNWQVKTFLDSSALEDNLKYVESPSILHIATHGKYFKDVDFKLLDFSLDTRNKLNVNPLLRSMLLFAGAQSTIFDKYPNSEDVDDGLFTAYEAMDLDLENTRLVVLSACETALGMEKDGEGVYGLQRAFYVAGASNMIISLWSVSDEATQELMVSLYEYLMKGYYPRNAFRKAQIHIRKKHPEFYYWGAFIVLGRD
jgi:CHAT domain-containing protein